MWHFPAHPIRNSGLLTLPKVIENFRKATADAEAKGDTALWDGLALAEDVLKSYSVKYPTAKK